MNNNSVFNSYASFIKERFGKRVQKISINTGLSCPNRDGVKGRGGCTYCNVESYSPEYCQPKTSVSQQLEQGILFFRESYPETDFLAYFQSYTNTYTDITRLEGLYLEALSHPKIIGLVIGTRPDCVNKKVLDLLERIAKNAFVSIEYGIESTLNKTLHKVNRCHTYEDTIRAFELSKNRGLHLGGHIILGLPGESREEMLNHANKLSRLPLNSLKIHHLQILKRTEMHRDFKNNPQKYLLFTADEYTDFVSRFLMRLRKDIAIDRLVSQSPKSILVAPNWNGIKNFEMNHKVHNYMKRKSWSQGMLFQNFECKTV